jgi:UPF0755 protein
LERSRKTLVILLLAFGFLTLICGGLIFLLVGEDLIRAGQTAVLRVSLSFREDELNQPMGTDDTPMRFTVSIGDTAARIARGLQDEGFIADADLFTAYARAERLDAQLEAGTYFLNETMNIKEIAHALTDSRFSQIPFTIIPGQRMEEIARAIDSNRLFAFSGEEFLQVVGRGAQVDLEFAEWVGLPPGASLEGFLYPESYTLPPEVTPLMLRDLLLKEFRLAVGEELQAAAAEQGYSLYEIVTLAAIVQREANRADEQPLIAGVYRNRLDIGMRLDADPTVQYPIGQPGDWWPSITQADYQGVISDYNTYRIGGLPPGPIANPTVAAIRAAIHPEPSNYYFFRADCRDDGYHDFATTYEEHLANGC